MKCDNLSCGNVMKAVSDAINVSRAAERGVGYTDHAHYRARHWNDYRSNLD